MFVSMRLITVWKSVSMKCVLIILLGLNFLALPWKGYRDYLREYLAAVSERFRGTSKYEAEIPSMICIVWFV